VFEALNLIKKNIQQINPNWNNINIINSSINEAGVKYLNNFKPFSENDLNSSNGLYFLNTSTKMPNLKKIINIKLLKYLESSNLLPKFCIEQNNGLTMNNLNDLKSQYKIYNYINLPNNVFFETSGSYLNTEGIFKKNSKICLYKQTNKRRLANYSKNIFLFKKD